MMKTLRPVIRCPLHSYELQGARLEGSGNPQFFCFSCLLKLNNKASSDIQTFPEIIEAAAKVYLQNKKSFQSFETPREYTDLLFGRAEILEQLSKHIEEEKKKTVEFFEDLKNNLITRISAEKEKYLNELDQQIVQLDSCFTTFEEEFYKVHCDGKDDVFPTKEELEDQFIRIQEFGDLPQLTDFIKKLQETICLEKESIKLAKKKAQKEAFAFLHDDLSRISELKPAFAFSDDFSKQILKVFDEKIKFQNPIENLFDPAGLIIKEEDFQTIKDWLPLNHPFNPVLLYKSSRDGAYPSSFHQNCDGTRNTITFAKVLFDGSERSCIIGGFLDKGWHRNGWIQSENAFLFSLTSKIKCPVGSQEDAAYGLGAYGPVFGGGHDLCISLNEKGRLHPSSYEGAVGLVGRKDYQGGKIEFKTIEVEVYSLD